MNIFGLGPLEILLIVVLALIVFGPAKLPEIMGQVGKAIADFRRATSELSDDFNRTIQTELQETRSIVDETKNAMTGAQASINAAMGASTAAVATPPAPALATAAPALTNGTNGTNGTVNGTNGTSGADAGAATASQWSWETAAPADKPVAAPAPPPAAQPPSTRKTTRHDDLLPPY